MCLFPSVQRLPNPLRKPYIRLTLESPRERANSMTIAMGFRCRNGVILAADSEISGYLAKWQEAKVASTFWTPDAGLALVYSGDVDYAQMLCEKLRTATLNSKPEYPVITDVIEKTVTKFFKGPVAAHPTPNELTVSLLIALRLANEPDVSLIKTSGTAVTIGHSCEFIGAGAELARYVMSNFYDPAYTTEEGALLAAYVLHEVKENIRGCGGLSTIVAVEPNSFGATRVKDIKKLERKFTNSFSPNDFKEFHPLLDRIISS
jgi:20S proteasome alpha/beta subunit